MDEDYSEDILRKANQKYNKLLENAQKVACAADFHPEIAFSNETAPIISSQDQDYGNEEEAMEDLRLHALLLSETWEETQKYFKNEFIDEVIEEYGGPDGVDEDIREISEGLMKKMKLTHAELWKLDSALEYEMENPPSSSECKIRMNGEGLPEEGDFF